MDQVKDQVKQAQATAEAKIEEIRADLLNRAAAMREELHKASESVKANPTVVKALNMYDQQVEMLRTAANSEAAKKIFELLSAAKVTLIAAIETASNSPMAQSVLTRLADMQKQAMARLQDYQGKPAEAPPAVAAN